MKPKICCFAGHSKLYGSVNLETLLYSKCEELILQTQVTCFWVGNYGSFDSLSAHTVQILKQKYPQIKLELILPYITNEINENKEFYYQNFDSILLANIPESTPAKFKILKCNEYMIDKSDFLIAYVNHTFGGAAKTFEYAQKKNIKICNLGTLNNVF